MKIKSFLAQFSQMEQERDQVMNTLEKLDTMVNTWLTEKNIEVHHVKVVYVGDRHHRVGVIMSVFYTENAG